MESYIALAMPGARCTPDIRGASLSWAAASRRNTYMHKCAQVHTQGEQSMAKGLCLSEELIALCE